MPALNYVSQTPQSVSVTYTDMPAAANLAFIDQVSGAQTAAQSGALATGGAGSAEIPIPDLGKGQYYLRAQVSGNFIAQTVTFYVNT
jgi:hypothetical protein